MRVLFVCTGNLCRSPMAEALLRDALRRRGCDAVEVASAGTWAPEGVGATLEAARELEGRGIELADHRSRGLVEKEVRAADLVVAMTNVHVREILTLVPDAGSKVILLKEMTEIGAGGGGATAAERLRALLAAPRPTRVRSLDVDDPVGLPAGAYRRCARELEAGIGVLADVLCGRGGISAETRRARERRP